MVTATYKGRKLRVHPGRGRDWGVLYVTVNGQTWKAAGTDEERELASLRRWIDAVDEDPEPDGDRWPAYWYAPGSYEMCEAGVHPKAIGGKCRHRTCQEVA